VPKGLNKFSRTITQTKVQGASQAQLFGTGLREEDLGKPQVWLYHLCVMKCQTAYPSMNTCCNATFSYGLREGDLDKPHVLFLWLIGSHISFSFALMHAWWRSRGSSLASGCGKRSWKPQTWGFQSSCSK